MREAKHNAVFPAYGKAVADCFQNVRETFSSTHERESHLASKCMETQDRIVEACLERIRIGDASPEEEGALWNQISEASERQTRIHARQIESGQDSRNAVVFIAGVALVGVVVIANPELAKSCAGFVGKGLQARMPKALI